MGLSNCVFEILSCGTVAAHFPANSLLIFSLAIAKHPRLLLQNWFPHNGQPKAHDKAAGDSKRWADNQTVNDQFLLQQHLLVHLLHPPAFNPVATAQELV